MRAFGDSHTYGRGASQGGSEIPVCPSSDQHICTPQPCSQRCADGEALYSACPSRRGGLRGVRGARRCAVGEALEGAEVPLSAGVRGVRLSVRARPGPALGAFPATPLPDRQEDAEGSETPAAIGPKPAQAARTDPRLLPGSPLDPSRDSQPDPQPDPDFS